MTYVFNVAVLYFKFNYDLQYVTNYSAKTISLICALEKCHQFHLGQATKTVITEKGEFKMQGCTKHFIVLFPGKGLNSCQILVTKYVLSERILIFTKLVEYQRLMFLAYLRHLWPPMKQT